MKVYLIRHGQTPGNAEGRYIGRTDEGLSAVGIDLIRSMAHVNARRFSQVDAVVTSPLLRCRQTAEILFPGISPQVDEGLRECDFGIFEGRSADEMHDDTAYRMWVDGRCKAPIPGGEGIDGFTQRSVEAFTRIARAQGPAVRALALVVHGGTIMAVLDALEGSRSYFEYHVDNGACIECELEETDDASLHMTVVGGPFT